MSSLGSDTITRTYPSAVPKSALFLVKYSPADVVTWYKTIGSASAGVSGYSITMAPCGQLWVSGGYSEDANIDGHILAVVPGADPSFIAGYNLAGGIVGYAGLGSGGEDENGIACDGEGNVFISGDIYFSTSIFAGPDTIINPYPSQEIFFIAKHAAVVDTTYDNNDTSVCGDTSLVLNSTPGYNTYFWNDSTTNSTLTVNATGTYFVYNIACSVVHIDSFHVTITPSDTLHHNYDTTVCKTTEDAYITIYLTAPAGSNYNWFDGSTGSYDSVHITGNYMMTYSTGCNFNIDTFKVMVISPCDTGNTKTGINIFTSTETVEIFPNPASTMLTIFATNKIISVAITDLVGQTVYTHEYNTDQVQVDVADLPTGMYLIRINSTEVRKFVKE